MKLSAEGKLRLAARLVFVVGVGVISADAYAADAAESDEQAATGGAYTGPATGAEVSTPGSAVQLGGVQVTGSRIKQPNLTGNAPVTVVGSQELQFQGTTRVEDLLNSLPQVFADQGANISNGSDGTATVNLRNLGASRTLVLIDGKRVQPGSPLSSAADLNFIPAQLIDKVEVLTGGASSVYGSDAVAGVVNFIMKRDFEGVRIDYQRSGYQHDNSSIYSNIPKAKSDAGVAGYATPTGSSFDGGGDIVTAVMGVNSGDGKGNLTAYATFQHNDSIRGGQRDYSACTLAESGTDSFACSGSSTTGPGGRFTTFNSTTFRQTGSYTLNSATGNTFRDYASATDAFNFGPYNYFLRNDERYGLGVNGHYKFSDAAEAYTSLMFSDDHTDAVIAPSGAFYGNSYTTPCSNPELSADQVQKICTQNGYTANQDALLLIGRRNIEGGGRDSDLRHTAYRAVLGLKGDLSDAWNYDVSAQYGTTLFKQIYRNDFSVVRLQRAFDVVADPTTGAATCRSVIDGSDPNCVPYNVFAANGVTPAALKYLQTPGFQTGQAEEQVVTGSISGQLGKYGLASPFAKDGLGVAFGSEYRRENANTETDNEFSTGDLAGQGGATLPSSGGFNVRELFAEARLPLVQDRFLAKDVSLEAGYRYSDYSSTSSTDTYKIAGDWAPTSDVRFRAGYNRAVRTPNIAELVSPVNVALDGSTDPCSGLYVLPAANGNTAGDLVTAVNPNAANPKGPAAQQAAALAAATATRGQCSNDPLIKANPGLFGNIDNNSAAQYNGLGGTDPAGLKPETADTYTGGVVFTPTFVKNLSITVDYFNIKVENQIGGLGADNILSQCYNNNNLCNLINRDPNPGPTFGSLYLGNKGYVTDFTTNAGSLAVHGIDFAANYRFKLSQIGLSNRAGSLSFDFVGTRDITEEHQIIPSDPGTTYTCNGKYGLQCGTPVPNWRHKLRGTYTLPTYWLDSTVTASAAWRYIGAVRADENSAPNNADARLASVSYMDATASISFKGAYTFRVGVNNVFDKDPPVIGSGALPGVFGNNNTFPQVYDALGRYAFAGITADF